MPKVTLYVPDTVESGTIWIAARKKAKEHNISLSAYVEIALAFSNQNVSSIETFKTFYFGDSTNDQKS